MVFMKGGTGAEKFLDIFVWFWCLVEHQWKNRQQQCGNYTHVKSSQFFESHRNVTKQTNLLQVDNLITNICGNLHNL